MNQTIMNLDFLNVFDRMTEGINYVTNTKYISLFIFMLSFVYAGYTLYPVPSKMNKMFNRSLLLKYVVLLVIAIYISQPLTSEKLQICLIVSVLVLLLFEVLRNFSRNKPLFHKIIPSFNFMKSKQSKQSKQYTEKECKREMRKNEPTKTREQIQQICQEKCQIMEERIVNSPSVAV
jgi:hypothetical protein